MWWGPLGLPVMTSPGVLLSFRPISPRWRDFGSSLRCRVCLLCLARVLSVVWFFFWPLVMVFFHFPGIISLSHWVCIGSCPWWFSLFWRKKEKKEKEKKRVLKFRVWSVSGYLVCKNLEQVAWFRKLQMIFFGNSPRWDGGIIKKWFLFLLLVFLQGPWSFFVWPEICKLGFQFC